MRTQLLSHDHPAYSASLLDVIHRHYILAGTETLWWMNWNRF